MVQTYTWIGNPGSAESANSSNYWTPSGGPPNTGDWAVINAGTAVLPVDAQLNQNTIFMESATISFTGATVINVGTPTLDSSTLITTDVTPAETAPTSPQQTELDSYGTFVNDGTIKANGFNGSSFTILIAGTTIGGTYYPGYFFNQNAIEVDAHNSMTISVAGTSELINASVMTANGGTLVINAASNAIAGGYAPVAGFALIEAGGTIETNVSYASTVTGQAPYFAFTDGTAGDTLKIDNVTQFGGRILGFQAGDTIDLGTSLSVSQAVYDSSTGILALENSGGTVVASLDFVTGGFQNGTFTVDATSGAIGTSGFTINAGTGDSLLTTSVQVPYWTNTLGGAWQTATDWSTNAVPGALDTPMIGLGSNATFITTTGSTAVSVGGLQLIDKNALLQITSDTTVTPYTIDDIQGTIELTGGNTLTASSLRAFYSDSTVILDSGARLDLTGHLNVGLAASNGTLGVASGTTFALGMTGGTLLVNGGTLASGGNVVIGYDGAGSPAIVNVQSSGVVTDTFALLSSDPTSFGSLTVTGASTTWTDQIDPNDTATTRGYMIVGYNNESSNVGTGVAVPAYSGTAQLLIDQNATVAEGSFASIGDSVNSAGSVTVQNGGHWNINQFGANNAGYLRVGNAGSGALSILTAGTVQVGTLGAFVSSGTTSSLGGIGIGISAGSSGTITVDGSGALLTSAAGISVGRAGFGLLDVVNGGSVALTGNGITVGVSSGTDGTLTVGGTGAAAALSFGASAKGMTVGQSGTALAQVLAGGSMTLSGSGGLLVGQALGASGTLLVSGGNVTEDVSGKGIAIGQTSGATGLVEVTNGSITQGSSSSGIGVGQSGSGTLEVLNGGTVSVVGGIAVGATAGGSGSLNVSGSGAQLQLTGTSGLYVGLNGSGIMTIGSLGQVTSAAGFTVGANSGSQGTLTVSGGTLTDTGNFFIGTSGTGAVTVAAGGSITVSNTVAQNALVGANSTGSGTLDVSGGQLGFSNEALFVGGQGNGSVTVENAGTITGSLAAGPALDISGSNAATVSVTGANSLLQITGQMVIGDSASGALSITNGAVVDDGISTIDIGNQTGGAGTVTVSGSGATLKGGNLNVANVTGAAATLEVDTGGTVNVSTLTVNGLVTLNAGMLIASSQIQAPSGGTISGSGTINTPQFDGAIAAATGGTLELTGGAIAFSPVFHIASGAALWLDSTVSSTAAPSLTFDTGIAPEKLILTAPQSAGALAISNWQNGDLLEFSNGATATNAFMQNGTTLVVDVTGAGAITSYSFTNVSRAAGTAPVFTVGTDAGNSYVELVSCFAPGTRIRTSEGDVAVEALAAGDAVVTASGQARPVRWIGHRRIDLTRHPAPELAQPIRIQADAIADGVPARDLLLSPDHALFLDGMLVPARLLVNGASITQETDCRDITYFHVELDAHDILLAENLPAESYLDTGNRAMFDNAAGPLLLHPFCISDQARREAESCAPLASDDAWTERLWRRLAVRATQLGLKLADDPETSDDPGLHIVADGRRLAPVSTTGDRYLFVLPNGCRSVALASRSALPNQLRPWLEDRRCLGVMLRSLMLRSGGTSVSVPLDHPSLREGWWAPEWHDASTLRRWTNGRAMLPHSWLAGLAGPVMVEITVAAVMHYVIPAEVAIAA